MSLFRRLKDFELLQDFSDEELQLLATFMEEHTFQDGEKVIDITHPSTDLLFVLKGQIKISSGGQGRANVFSLLEGPCLLGELSFADQQPRSANAAAVGTVEAVSFSYDHFQIIMKQNSVFGMKFLLELLKSLAKKFRATNLNLDAAMGQ
jgi:CRP-like cAMP-binding protein